MARILEASLWEICPDLDSAAVVTPYIAAANLLVTDVVVAADSTISDERLTQIELWLAAHFASVAYLRAAEERADVVGEKKQFKVDLGLSVTVYGQQALVLDTTGALANLQKLIDDGGVKVPSFDWLGDTATDLGPASAGW